MKIKARKRFGYLNDHFGEYVALSKSDYRKIMRLVKAADDAKRMLMHSGNAKLFRVAMALDALNAKAEKKGRVRK